MPEITPVTDDFSTAPQLSPDDVADLAARGFSSVICFRPDNESPGQPTFAAIADACKAHGIRCSHVPVVPGQIGPQEIDAARAAFAASPSPVLGYCASGMRAKMLHKAANE